MVAYGGGTAGSTIALTDLMTNVSRLVRMRVGWSLGIQVDPGVWYHPTRPLLIVIADGTSVLFIDPVGNGDLANFNRISQ